ncbi:MAG: alpha/beta hydrolase [Bacteroidetes bacterium]|nr:alpha/beta hydrolase [Bacteroidota bacterium]
MIKKRIPSFLQVIVGLLLCFLVAASGCRKSPQAVIPSSYQEKLDLAYGTDTLQRYDLFLPEGRSADTKMILLIHGGGWVTGNKRDCDYYARQFAAAGFAAISMNYRLANDSIHYRHMLADIDSMIACLSENASAWGVGSSSIALFGYSAGGHLALLYSSSGNRKQSISSVVSLAGPSNVQDTMLWKTPYLLWEIKLMEGDTLPANWSQANPIHLMNAGSPPTLLIHGVYDSVVPVSQSVNLNQVMKAINAPVHMLLLDNETHYLSSGATATMLEETKTFLNANMK